MTAEERQRQLDFILDSLARLTFTTSQLVEAEAHDFERITRDRARKHPSRRLVRDSDQLGREFKKEN